MKAAVITAPGAAPGYADFPEPVVGEGQELVELVATGVHPLVRALAEGGHYGSTGRYPLIPGVEAVARTSDGALVYTGYVRAPYGTQAERMAVPGGMRTVLPEGADPVQVAAGMNPGLSSWLPLRRRLEQTETLGTVVVLGATGTAGLLGVQNAQALGSTHVIGAGRDPEGLDRVAATGATPVQLSGERSADTVALTRALEGHSPGSVLDYVWGAPAEAMFEVLAGAGLEQDTADIAYLQIGGSAGPEAALPASLLRSRRITLAGSGAGSTPIATIMAELPVYLGLIAAGTITVPTSTYGLPEITRAWAASRRSGTRTVIIPV